MVVIITLHVDDILEIIRAINRKLMEKAQVSQLGHVLLELEMQASRGHEQETFIIPPIYSIKPIVARFGIKTLFFMAMPGLDSGLPMERTVATLLNKEDTQRYQAMTGTILCVAQITRYDVIFPANQLARAMSKPAKVPMGASKRIKRYYTG